MSPSPNEFINEEQELKVIESEIEIPSQPINLECHGNEIPPQSTIYTISPHVPMKSPHPVNIAKIPLIPATIIRRVTISGGDRLNSALTVKKGSAHLTPMSTPIPPPTIPTPTPLGQRPVYMHRVWTTRSTNCVKKTSISIYISKGGK